MTYDEQAETVARLLKEQLGVRGKSLEKRTRRAGRLLPRAVRRDIDLLVEAVRMQASPTLARMVDHAAVQKAGDRAIAHLKTIDPWKRRTNVIIGFLSTNALNLLIVTGLVFATLRWRGLA